MQWTSSQSAQGIVVYEGLGALPPFNIWSEISLTSELIMLCVEFGESDLV